MKYFGILLIIFLLIACDNNGLKTASYNYDDNGIEASKLENVTTKRLVNSEEIQDQKIIKTANLRFETKDVEETHQHIIKLVLQYQGFIQNDNSGKNYNRTYIRMTVRVPSEKFDPVLQGISEGVGYFDQKEITQKDVTEEFVDVNARLKAKRKLESRYLELLQQAKNVKEMLEIERELSKIREEIEAKEGRLNFLENKVSLSTFYIEFYKTSEIKGVTVSYGQKIINALKGGWNAISTFFLGILFLWPFIILLGFVIYLIRKYVRNQRNK